MSFEVGTLRTLFLFVPVLAATVAWLVVRPDERRRNGAIVGFAWNATALLALHPVADRAGWWWFHAEGGRLLGMPADVWIGWAVAWGVLPALLVTRPSSEQIVGAVAVAFWSDLVLMPLGAPLLVLGPDWLHGEVLHLVVALAPGVWLAEATRSRRFPAWSATLQTLAWWVVLVGLVPAATLAATGGEWPADLRGWRAQVGLQGVALALVVFLAAVRAFVEDGGGTPIPLDPPRRLVATGPYAYVANPMQLASAVALVAVGLAVGSPWIAAGAVVVVVYSEGLARWHERATLPDTLPGWAAWRASVRAWWPRWRPAVPVPATLWYARSCDACSALAAGLGRLGPVGLVLRPAEEHPGAVPDRLTWEREGCPVERGFPALCRALEHVHLGWAAAAWLGRLPVVRWVGQIATDALGGAPRRLRSS